jgi:hypothetical protein
VVSADPQLRVRTSVVSTANTASMYDDEPDWDDDDGGAAVDASPFPTASAGASSPAAAMTSSPRSVVARYDYIPEKADELRLSAGDVVSIGAGADESGWMTGELRGVVGAFPAA